MFFRGLNESKQMVTNRAPEYVEVVFGNYKRYYAEVHAYYERLDIVILTITTKDELTPLTLGDSDSLILGDDVYSARSCPFKLEGQTLHAKTIGFIHPKTLEYIEIDAPLPNYFIHLLDIL